MTCDIAFVTSPNWDVSNCLNVSLLPLFCDTVSPFSFWGVCRCWYILVGNPPFLIVAPNYPSRWRSSPYYTNSSLRYSHPCFVFVSLLTPELYPQAYRHRPFKSLDDELDHQDEDDDHDDYNDHDYIDDGESDNSDSIWESLATVKILHVVFSVSFVSTRNTEEMEISTRKSPTHLPGPSAHEPKLPIIRCNGPSTLEIPDPAVTSGQVPSFPTFGAFTNIFSFRLSCPPYSEFSTPATRSSSRRQSIRRWSILGPYYHYALFPDPQQRRPCPIFHFLQCLSHTLTTFENPVLDL